MKLLIRKKYLEEIRQGKKTQDFMDAHITFICEETGENLRKEIKGCRLLGRGEVPAKYRKEIGDGIAISFLLSEE